MLAEVWLNLVSRGESARQQFPNLAQLIRSKPQISQAKCADALERREHYRAAFDDEQRIEFCINAQSVFPVPQQRRSHENRTENRTTTTRMVQSPLSRVALLYPTQQ